MQRLRPWRFGLLWINVLAIASFLFLGADVRAAGGPNVITSPDSAFHAFFISLVLEERAIPS